MKLSFFLHINLLPRLPPHIDTPERRWYNTVDFTHLFQKSHQKERIHHVL